MRKSVFDLKKKKREKWARGARNVPACKEKEEAIAIPRTESIDRCIVLRVRVGKHELRFLAAAVAPIGAPPAAPRIFMYVTLCTRRESVGKHGTCVRVMVRRNSVGMGLPGRGGLDPIDHKPRPRHITCPFASLRNLFLQVSDASGDERGRKRKRDSARERAVEIVRGSKWKVNESSITRIATLFLRISSVWQTAAPIRRWNAFYSTSRICREYNPTGLLLRKIKHVHVA